MHDTCYISALDHFRKFRCDGFDWGRIVDAYARRLDIARAAATMRKKGARDISFPGSEAE
jgi:hypothetical protein